MTNEFRRVITGIDDNGKHTIVYDGISPNQFSRPQRPGVRMHNMWQTDSTPASIDGEKETVAGEFVLHPPKGGSVFRIIEFMPEDPDVIAKIDGQAAFAEMGAAHNVIEGARHPFMHATDTVDYAIIISGEITMLMDEEDVQLKAGDVLVQRGTNHAWSNRGTEPCVIAFVLIDGSWKE